MATIYSKVTGKPIEVSDSIYNDMVEFEASARGQILTNHSTQPIEYHHTHNGMMRLGQFSEESRIDEAQAAKAKQEEAEKLKLEPPPMDPKPGSDWSDLVG